MKHIFYIIPNLLKVSGGPRSRINAFKKVFLKKDNLIIEKRKFSTSLSVEKNRSVYVESATNRISIIDFFSLLILKLKSKEVIVFIRDVYIECFPEEYQTFRKKITLILNKLSNFYLSWIATKLAFPTKKMGFVFYKKNKFFIKKPFFDLPPGTSNLELDQINPNFQKKIGILYLGGISYKNSGFDSFVAFSKKHILEYDFYVLSNDEKIQEYLDNNHIIFKTLLFNEIPGFIIKKNIAFAIHTRPRNTYDDITFPIKILDFVNFGLPFISAKHIPLVDMLGSEYNLFCDITNFDSIINLIKKHSTKERYNKTINLLKKIHTNNTYDLRYETLFK